MWKVLQKSHNEGTWFTCHICQKKFAESASLKDHMRRHEGVKPYVCSECQKRFSTAYELKSHQPKHSDFKPFCCGSCGKYFKVKKSVIQHFKRCDKPGVELDVLRVTENIQHMYSGVPTFR